MSAEYKPKRPWQAYLLAGLMVSVGFLFANAVFNRVTESELAPSLAQETKVEETAKTEKPKMALSEEKTEPVAAPEPTGRESIYTASYPAPPEEKVADAPVLTGFSALKTEISTPDQEQVEPAEEASSPEPPTVEQATFVGPQVQAIAADETEEKEVTQDQVELARDVVNEFYGNLDSGNLGSAYDKLGAEFQESLSFGQFRDGYSQTQDLSCEIKNSELVADDLVRLDVQIGVTEAGVPTQYFATCLVSKEGDNWALAGVVQLEG